MNEAGDTPLSFACSHGDLKMVKVLINKHVDPNSKCLSLNKYANSNLVYYESTTGADASVELFFSFFYIFIIIQH